MSTAADVKNVRTPQTHLPVLNCIKTRFSPRIFSSTPIPPADLETIMEAGRLAPSGRNNQPWYFYIIHSGTDQHTRLFDCIPVKNHWAKTAPVILIACYDPTDSKDTINRWAQYDLGAAVMSIVLQAWELGYSARQIGSFDWAKTKQTFAIPDPLQPFILLPLGKMGSDEDYQHADPEMVQKDLAPHPKKPQISETLS